MIVLRIAIIAFIIMELSNVIIMYFKPEFRYGNSMKTFNEWDKSKQDESKYLFAKYMVRWVANCKLIFIAMLIVVAIWGNETVLLYSVIATILSIGIYFFTLHPIIKKLDQMGEITPKGYSKTLSILIASFMIMFICAIIIYYLIQP